MYNFFHYTHNIATLYINITEDVIFKCLSLQREYSYT
jgi:hypothetical protein